MTGSVIYLNISVTFYTLSEVKAPKKKQLKKEIKVEVDVIERDKCSYKLFFFPPESPWAYDGTKQKNKKNKKHKWERNQKWLVVTAPRLQETGSDLRIFHLECLLPAFSSLLLFLTSDVLRRTALTLSDSVFFCFFFILLLFVPPHADIFPPQEAPRSCLPVLKVEWKC